MNNQAKRLTTIRARCGACAVLVFILSALVSTGGAAAATDTVVPTGAFKTPASGATVSGTITVSGTAADNVGVSKVEVRVDEGSYALASGTSNWSLQINTTAFADGAHNLKLRITDTSGNQAWEDDPIVVKNASAPSGATDVGFSSPASGVTVGGTVTVTGTASAAPGVSKVEVRVDEGSYVLASGTSNWSLQINTTAIADGAHNLKARVTDAAGGQAWSDLPIVISNAAPTGSATPSVTFTSPKAGSTVSGTITVTGTAGGLAGVARVEVLMDQGNYQLASGTTSWSLTINTSSLSAGSHNLKARVTDLTGKQAWADDPFVIGSTTSTGTKIYWGANIQGSLYGFSSPPWDWRPVDTFTSHTGKKLSLLALGSNWGSSDNTFPTGAMTTIRNNGSIPFYNWASTSTGTATDPNYQLSDIINGTYDSYIRTFAQAAKAWGHPFFLRFDWEMNLMGTYPWVQTVNGNSSGQYVTMWRHVHDIFTSVGATNATWVWCPNAEYNGSFKPLTSLYPGDSYVDWTCIDGYNWGTNPITPGHTWQTFSSVIGPTYTNLTGTVAPSKPVIIGETASTEYGGSKASWITDMLGTQLPKSFPKIKAFLWFNWQDKGDWPIETSSSAQSAFAAGIKSSYYAANDFATLGGTKVVPLP